jgi:intracellular sulfur oxidation DsrE/DsrF family protein
MKSISLLLLLLSLTCGFVHGQSAPYRVVFDLTSRDSLDQKAVIRWVSEISAAYPRAELEVVMYGNGLELVMPERSTVIEDVRNVITRPNVSFKVCRVAMKNNNVNESQLANGVQIVPDAIFEIISKQHEGWGYIKVAH